MNMLLSLAHSRKMPFTSLAHQLRISNMLYTTSSEATKRAMTCTSETVQQVHDWKTRLLQHSLHDVDEITASNQQLLKMTIDPTSLSCDRAAAVKKLSNPEFSSALKSLPPIGASIHPGTHFTLFPIRTPEPLLALDGYDTDWSPPSPFLQRMWAGGVIEWHAKNPLTIGQTARQTTRMADAQLKPTGRGNAVFVTIQKNISNDIGPAITEHRSYVYLENKPEITSDAVNAKRAIKKSLTADFQTTVLPSTISLFRFSAITFNSHLIHYDHIYASKKEGYPVCLVHGPMTCTLLLDLFQRNANGKQIRKFSYRAISAVLVGKPLTLNGKWATDSAGKPYCELWATNDQGGMAMKGTVEFD
ncbi:hypothetical protein QVD99_004828 [Batrachochytrium dendrobatidis]|nr:hypothetical protein QVD99_004828 [Batrachochytrium dendrobatidis]